MGVSDSVEMEDAQEYYSDDKKATELLLNTKANVRSISITIEMEGRGYGKADKLAEAIAKKWKSKITSGKSEMNKNGTYKISGKTSKGDIIIRSSGKGTVTIEINFDYTEE
jgi:hypothetical protein